MNAPYKINAIIQPHGVTIPLDLTIVFVRMDLPKVRRTTLIVSVRQFDKTLL